MAEEDFALVEAAMADGAADERPAADPAEAPVAEPAPRPRRPVEPDELDDEFPDPMRQALIDQAMQQSDGIDSDRPRRPREPDY